MRAHPAGKLGEGATAVTGAELCERLFQSTPPARGATSQPNQPHSSSTISIHAPREGGDEHIEASHGDLDISIHAPREGGDFICKRSGSSLKDFNPRPPRGGRPGAVGLIPPSKISIHAPREGGDLMLHGRHALVLIISIHAPREGGDL